MFSFIEDESVKIFREQLELSQTWHKTIIWLQNKFCAPFGDRFRSPFTFIVHKTEVQALLLLYGEKDFYYGE